MKYKLIQKGIPGKPEEKKKWYANAVNQGTISKHQISQDIEGRSSLTRGDISNVLDNLIDELPKYLIEGKSVKLGDFGTFRLSLSSKGVEDEKEFDASMIKNAKVVFTPGTLLKKKLMDIKFERVK